MKAQIVSIGRSAVRAFGLGGFAAGLALAGAAYAQPLPPAAPPEAQAAPADAPARASRRARPQIAPYLEISQVISADLSGGDVLTYTAVAAGVDGRVSTRRVTVQASYRYERRIALEGDLPQEDVHSGVAQVGVELLRDTLHLDAGAMAARTGGDGGIGFTDRQAANQIYSAYVGPTLSTHSGPVAINATYRLGYVHVDQSEGLAGGPRPEDYGSSTTHSATASVGMSPRELPVGWTIGAGYSRDEGGELDNRFEGVFVRGDVVVPVGPTLALTAGVGYEDIQSSQQEIQRTAGGVPIITPDGRLVADPSRPRLLTYDTDGIIYDAGVIWRPGPRTELQARAGRRYGGTTVTASVQHQINANYAVNAQIYDTVGTFGQLTIDNLSNLPDDFDINRNPLTGGLGGCAFGRDPGTGVCFDQALQTISSSTFRNRGASILFSGERGPWNLGLGAGYSHRRYFRPVSGDLGSISPRTDQSFTLNGSIGRSLSRTSSVDFDAYAGWFDSDVPAFDPVFSSGITGSYHRSFLFERLRLNAALGLYTSDSDRFNSTVASGLLGLRYSF